MTHEGGCVLQNHAGIDTALAELILPNRFTGLRFDGMNCTITGSCDEQTSTIDLAQDGCRVSRIEGTSSRRTHPNCLTRPLVKGHETVAGSRLSAPARGNPADNQQVSLDDGRYGATTVSCHNPEILRQRTLPKQFAIV